ncbi:MAG TPA: ATPase [Thermodesulfobacteriota bacterium]|nr:ATPase [Thermodesulfobacteriota bacterium]
MKEYLGQRLIREKVIDEQQLDEALERQKLRGGRLGTNLVALHHIAPDDLERFLKRHPYTPKGVTETGLELSFITDLVMKHILLIGEFNLKDLAVRIKLPIAIIDHAVQILRKDRFIEVKGAGGFMRESFNFNITEKGRHRGQDLLELNRYVGPAPVPLEDYRSIVELQTIKHIYVSERRIADAFSHLVISDTLRRLGPAVSSGRAIFLYGPPGNGKTTIADTIGNVLPGAVCIPYSILVGSEVITVFDPVTHIPVKEEGEKDNLDQRWVNIKRPVVMTGGELTIKMLDLNFNPVTKFYEAPLQMKANNGVFIVDDFGRQQISPENLLNRWIVPLERGEDFLTLHTGMKFEIPFDQLVIFATNIEPGRLVDEAFLRRIRYKIQINHPTEQEYEEIFRRVCAANGIDFRVEVFDHLMSHFYRRLRVRLNACHPRDIIDHIIDSAHYHNRPPEMTIEGVTEAWENYFVEM